MNHRYACLALLIFTGCAASPAEVPSPSPSAPFLKAGDDCTQGQYEARWLAGRVAEKQKWFRSNSKRYSSSMESLIGELSGELRYNAMFLRTESGDDLAWSFYTNYGAPRTHGHNLFRSIARDDNTYLERARRRVWVDSRYRTIEFTEADLEKICPDCLASKDRFKAAIVAKFPSGEIDLWVVDHATGLTHILDGCKK